MQLKMGASVINTGRGSVASLLALLIVSCTAQAYAADVSAFRTYGDWHSGKIGGGGFVQYLVFSPSDPNRDYVTTDVGGLYRSDDAGQHWHMLGASFPADPGSYSARGLVVAPDNADHVVAAMGAGDSGVNGIYVSDDGGGHWHRTLKARFDGNGDYRSAGPILITSPADPKILYCAAIETGVYKSADFGETWSHLPAAERVQPTGLLLDRDRPGHLWLTTANYKFDKGPARKGLYYSADDGAHWDYINAWSPQKMIQGPTDAKVIIASTERDQISRSADGGRTWQRMSNGIPPFVKENSWTRPGSINGLAIANNDLIAAAQSGDFYRFDQSTQTWHKIVRQGVDEGDWWGRMGPGRQTHFGNALSHIGVDPRDANHWWFTDWYSLYQSDDAGLHWKWTTDGIEMLCVHCVRQDPSAPMTVHVGAADIGYFRSDNGGDTYTWINKNISNNIKDIRVCPAMASRVYALGPKSFDWYSNQVFISNDHGMNWRRSKMTGLPDMTKSRCNTIAVDPKNPDHVFLTVSDAVGPKGGGVYESVDGAQSWAWKGEGLPQGKSFFHKDIWVAGPELDVSLDGSLVASSDDLHVVYFFDKTQNRWVRSKGADKARPNDVMADPRTAGRFYLAGGSGGLLRSDDGGRSWNPLSKIDASYVTVDETNSDRIAAITNDNVYYSDDAGRTFTAIGATLPYRGSRDVAGFAGDRLVVGTGGCSTFWIDLKRTTAKAASTGTPPIATAPTAGPLPILIAAADTHLLYAGRFDRSDPSSARCDWSNSGITLRFRGTAVNAILSSPQGQAVWQVVVDDMATFAITLQKQPQIVRVADNLTDGFHTVSLVQRTEALFGTSRFDGFQVRGEPLAVAPPMFNLLVIGDSISCGYGDEAAGPQDHFSARTENGTLTYGALAARAVDAGYTCIAWSGKLLWPKNTLPALFDRTLADDAGSHWNFAGPAPDAIVINLGTNDIWSNHGKDPDEAAWVTAYKKFIDHVREHAPRAVVYCAVGPMVTDASSPSRHALTSLRRYLHRIVDERTVAGDKKMRFLEFASQRTEDGVGSDWHPSLTTHRKMAAVLVTALRSDFPALALTMMSAKQ